jgi:hypothetical protein
MNKPEEDALVSFQLCQPILSILLYILFVLPGTAVEAYKEQKGLIKINNKKIKHKGEHSKKGKF